MEDYQQYILDRRDLLVPENIREWKGTFFTPSIWAAKSKEYLSLVFGDNWQEEYYVWDCAAGTGNLLAGLTNPYNVWASDISQNRLSCEDGVNHWIPFTEKQVGAKEKFASNFMSGYLAERGIGNGEAGTGFSREALSVYKAGLALWKYYHKTSASVNASFYDIRAFFQGRDATGRMNAASEDETYNALLKTLRDSLKTLAEKIQPKVYEYEFLKE